MKYEYGIYLGEECIEEYEDSSSAYHQAAAYTRESGNLHTVRKNHDTENEYNVYINDVLCAAGYMNSILNALANQVKSEENRNTKEINIKIIKQENKVPTKKG